MLEGLSDSMSRGVRVGCWAKSVLSNIFSFRRPTVHQVFVCMCVCIKVCVYQGQDSSVGFKILRLGSRSSTSSPSNFKSNPSANCSRLRPPLFYRLRPPPPHLMMGLILSMCILLDHWPFLITACSVWNWKVSAIRANWKVAKFPR